MPEPAVRLHEVTKEFGSLRAVSDLDLEIPQGSIYGILGPNGSGKTTTIRMVMGILVPDRGRVALFGGDPGLSRRERVGYLPEERGLYRKMRVLEHLVFLARLHGVERKAATRRAHGWLERLELAGRAEKPVEELSKGMQQKVQFIGTVLHEPDLLVLDEPFSGLDPLNQDVLEQIVRELHAAGTTILFSTHLMDQAERLCEHVCLIARSRKVLDGPLARIKRDQAPEVVAVEFEGPDGWLDHPGIRSVQRTERGVRVRLGSGSDPGELLRRAVASGARILRYELVEPRLHEVFVRHAVGSGLP
jgi:ABC-2 type transport system ATP-binding protein